VSRFPDTATLNLSERAESEVPELIGSVEPTQIGEKSAHARHLVAHRNRWREPLVDWRH